MHKELIKRKECGHLRELNQQVDGIDFYSNDYLGLARNQLFQEQLHALLKAYPAAIMGSTGSRLISGNSRIKMEVEAFIAEFHQQEKALLFPNGYAANLALFSCILNKEDVLIMDEKIHRSIYDGSRLSFAKRWKFKHNDLHDLTELLKRASRRSTGNIFVVVESLYSMHGDLAPIQSISELVTAHGAKLIIDEAHSLGVFGLDCSLKQEIKFPIFARILSYGKAMGIYGGAILGSKTLIDYLINFSSPFIYSTSMSDFSYLAVKESYSFIQAQPNLANQLKQVIQDFSITFRGSMKINPGPIQPLFIPDPEALHQTVTRLNAHGLHCYAVRYPAVGMTESCIRITLHPYNTLKDIQLLNTLIQPK
ncbi:MAG TPA: pyridoxal phosphate-dependent aminotransferase family protein [Sphingobacteriaceae bacterium]|nr:pyridoxal phosphate-dependent aminotransferase family protein [Sphingobacteriaceae bacterium]